VDAASGDEIGIIICVLFITVFATVDFVRFIREIEDMGKFLLDGGNTAGIMTADNAVDFPGKDQSSFFYDDTILDDVYGNVMINESQNVKVQGIDIAFHFQNIFFAHLAASGILDDGNGTVEFIKAEVMIDGHALAGLNMIKYETFFNFSYV
jgi:hypothetical protein